VRNLTDPIENWINSREGGLVLSHEWSGTSLRVQNQDETWGSFVELVVPQGVQGEQGLKCDQGNPPAHQWTGASLQFENPDGSWGEMVSLKGDTGPQGVQGPQGVRGVQGDRGDRGAPPNHNWMGSELQFENPNGSWGELVESNLCLSHLPCPFLLICWQILTKKSFDYFLMIPLCRIAILFLDIIVYRNFYFFNYFLFSFVTHFPHLSI